MRVMAFVLAAAAAMPLAAVAWAAGGLTSSPPKGCYEKSWSKAELKKLPLQNVTAVRLEANIGTTPESKPQAYGRLMARFRQTGPDWLATAFECNNTGAGFACASTCDGSVFVLSAGSSGLQLMPPQGVLLAGPDCDGTTATLSMNADQQPFSLGRRGNKSCPAN